MAQRRTSKIANVIDALKQESDLKEEIRRYFHFDSQLWKAIRDHIAQDEDCVLIERLPRIVSHRGTGPAVNFRNAHPYLPDYSVKPPKESEVYSLGLEIEYWDEDDQKSYHRTYSINVPVALEVNFTRQAFDTWVAELRAKRDAERAKADLANLATLITKYPKEARKLLKK